MPYRKFQPDVSLNTDSAKCYQRFRQISEYIFKHIGRPIQSVELAELLGLSPSYFSRTFHQVTGLSPTNYILTWRVNVAKHMLINSRRPLVDIAISCGFSSQSHLQSAFKRMVGVTPAAWRNGERQV